jgi:hypothetical protein
VVAVTSLLSRGTKVWKDAAKDSTGVIATLSTVVSSSTGAFMALVAVLGVIIGYKVGQWAYNQVPGMKLLQQQTEYYKESVEELEEVLEDLQYRQRVTSESGQMLQYQIAQLEFAIEMQGGATEQQEALLHSLNMQQMQFNLGQQQSQMEITRTKNEADGLNRSIDEMIEKRQQLGQYATRRLFGEYSGGFGAVTYGPQGPLPGAQLGAEIRAPGLLYAHTGEYIVSPDQMAMGRSGGGFTIGSVTISLAGAQLNNSMDVEGAMRRGARAFDEELQLLEFKRRKG